jgi:hypothetical protein
MAESDRTGAANLHGLARVQRERRWLTIMDSVLALSIVSWIAGLTLGLIPPALGWVMPVVICVVGVHRVLVTMERHRRERAQAVVPMVPRQLSRAGH